LLEFDKRNSAKDFQNLNDQMISMGKTLDSIRLDCENEMTRLLDLKQETAKQQILVKHFEDNDEEYIKIRKTVEEKVTYRTTVIQPIDCSTYTIAGENACTVTLQSTFTAESLGIKAQTMLMLSYINGTIYYFQAGAPQSNFGQIFPIFFHMLSSFKPARP
jgi:hypothetical protein